MLCWWLYFFHPAARYWADQVLINAWRILLMPLTIIALSLSRLCCDPSFAKRDYIKSNILPNVGCSRIIATVYRRSHSSLITCTQPDFWVTGPLLPIVWFTYRIFISQTGHLTIGKITFEYEYRVVRPTEITASYDVHRSFGAAKGDYLLRHRDGGWWLTANQRYSTIQRLKRDCRFAFGIEKK